MTDSTSTANTATVAAEGDPATPVVGTTGDAPQQPSGMPTHKYLPFHEQIQVEAGEIGVVDGHDRSHRLD